MPTRPARRYVAHPLDDWMARAVARQEDAEAVAEWREWGRFYGYPECCIEHFVRLRLDPKADWPADHLVSESDPDHGWVPCPHHRAHPPPGYVLKTGGSR
jgi:hypothetical protein